MEALRQALERHSAAAVMSGVTMGGDREGAFDRAGLLRDLSAINRRNEKYFLVGIVLAVILFLALIVIAFLQYGGSTAAQAVPPILGTSAAVVVWRMFTTWREKSYTDCVLALIPNVDDDMLRTIVGVLVKKI